jgi:hypothetical protein
MTEMNDPSMRAVDAPPAGQTSDAAPPAAPPPAIPVASGIPLTAPFD